MDPNQYRPRTGDIPTAPGVYRYWDADDRVVYVGKAKNLRNRLTSYFVDQVHPRTREMLWTACRLDWVTVGSETEALQLEHTWIQEYEPRFNVRFRDDKSYPWLALTLSDEFPRAVVVRGNRRRDWRYFGPFVQAWLLRDSIDRLLRIYPIRTCSETVFNRAHRSGRACLLGYIDKCSAPCIGRIDAVEHRRLVEGFSAVFEGKSGKLLRELEARMQQASADLDFEAAARLRDGIAAVQTVGERSAVVLEPGVNADLIGLAADELAAAVQVFLVRDGRLTGQRSFVTDRPDDGDLAELMSHALHSVYADAETERPAEILVSNPPPDFAVERGWLSADRRIDLRVPERGDKAQLMQTVVSNADQALRLYRSRRGADLAARGAALTELGEALGLPNAPLRIECIDVSHLDGEQVVASLVVFEDGLPLKRDYRRFVLRHGLGNNDVASIAEVVQRRFSHVETVGRPTRFAYPPNLLVVDGGKPQVTAAAAALVELGVDLPVVGLAKRLEEVWVAGNADPLILPRRSEALFLLQRLRDEAHRFAISHSRQRVRKSRLASLLDEVAGLGPTKRDALLKAFGSLKRMRQASEAELAAVKGIGPALAAAVHAKLAAELPTTALNTATGELSEGA